MAEGGWAPCRGLHGPGVCVWKASWGVAAGSVGLRVNGVMAVWPTFMQSPARSLRAAVLGGRGEGESWAPSKEPPSLFLQSPPPPNHADWASLVFCVLTRQS